jgi:hypothetical protein
VGCAWVSDIIIDNFVSPRVMSNALKIHPAAVLVMVLVSASLFGFIGILLSAPVLASLKLLFTYIARKLMDMDPWSEMETYPEPVPLHEMIKRFKRRFQKKPGNNVSKKSLKQKKESSSIKESDDTLN